LKLFEAKTVFHEEEKRSLLGSGATVALLHVVGWGVLLGIVIPEQVRSGGNTSTVLALALSAYFLGVVHALDVDHIVAIDNVTRRLISLGRRPMSVGLWFALGHSTIVLVSVVLIVVGIDGFAGTLLNDTSILRGISGVWGPAVSGLFLIFLGFLNLSALKGLRSMRKNDRPGKHSESELEKNLVHRGLLSRIWQPLLRIIDKPVNMYPVGMVFGLGLDTAASISLLVVGGLVIGDLVWYGALVLPILFASGMTLFDSLDGIVMSRVYRGASMDPDKKLQYNLVVTSVSVAVAFLVGGALLISMLFDLVNPSANFIDLRYLGVTLLTAFCLAWISALLWSRYGELHSRVV
jgi:high-affinity nickel-transport protein